MIPNKQLLNTALAAFVETLIYGCTCAKYKEREISTFCKKKRLL